MTRIKTISRRIWKFVSNKKNILIFVLFLFLLFGVQIGLFFITEQTVSYNDKEYSGSNEEVLRAVATEDDFIEIIHGEERVQQSIELLGAQLNEEVLSSQLESRRPVGRLIPVVGLFSSGGSLEVKPTYSVDEDQLQRASEELAASLSYDAENAGLYIEDETLKISKEKDGSLLTSDVVSQTLKQYFDNPQSRQVMLAGETISAELTTKELEPIVETYESLLLSSLIVQLDDKEITLSPDDILNLVEVTPDSLQFSRDSAEELVRDWIKDIVITPGTTTVTYVDDKETDRETGADGRTFAVDEILQEISLWVDDPKDGTVLSFESYVVPARVIENRSYTNTSAGLSSLINTWDSQNTGTYSVYIEELSSRARRASLSADTPWVMASTYKVFLSAVAYSLSENSELSLNTKVYGSNTVEDCIRVGIINSDNPCMIALGKYIGWKKVDQTIATMGFSNTSLNNYNADGSFNGDKTSTARDMAEILKRLASGTLISNSNATKLRSYMAQDIYDDGIPAGSKGAKVEHKVGFLEALKHDMGIVYSPDSTYVLVVLSDNATWSRVADLSEKIYDFLN